MEETARMRENEGEEGEKEEREIENGGEFI